MKNILIRGASLALIAVSALVLGYVVYSHVASWRLRKEYDLLTYSQRFPSDNALHERFEIRVRGPLQKSTDGSMLHVHGSTGDDAAQPAEMRFVGPVQRLDDRVRVAVRFRARTNAPFDVYVGLQKASEEKDIRLFFRNGQDRLDLAGDIGSDGGRVLKMSPAGHVGEADRERTHDLAFTLMALPHAATTMFDGAPTGSHFVDWKMGTPVRLVFGVIGREAGHPVDVEFEQADYETFDKRGTLPSFSDKFAGKFLDPTHWIPMVVEEHKGESLVRTSPGGLRMQARSIDARTSWFAAGIMTPPFALRSLRMRVRMSIDELHEGAVVADVLGQGITISGPRVLDVGVLDGRDGRIAFMAGHWKGDGSSEFIAAPPTTAASRDCTFEVEYDALRRMGIGRVNGVVIAERELDLRPIDEVTLRVALSLNGKDGKADILIREIALDYP